MMEDPVLVVEHLADAGPAAQELGARRVDVVDHEHQPLDGARCGRRDARAEDDGAGRAGRRQLHHTKVGSPREIGVQPPAEAGVVAPRAIDVGNREHDDLELRRDASDDGPLACGLAARLRGAHGGLRGVGQPRSKSKARGPRSREREVETRIGSPAAGQLTLARPIVSSRGRSPHREAAAARDLSRHGLCNAGAAWRTRAS